MKCAVIFGVTGQDGAFLAKLLVKKKYRVIGVSRNVGLKSCNNLDRIKVREKIELVSSSKNNFNQVMEIVKAYRPCEIYNLAGQSSVALSFEKPVETFESISLATLNILETIRALKIPVKFYNAGSGDCFGNVQGQAVTEETPFKPQSPYGVAKASAHWHVATYRMAYDMYACTGILFNHESQLRSDLFVTQKIVKTACQIVKGNCKELLLGDISIERDWGWAPEYVTAMWKMLQQEKPEDYIIASGTTLSLKDFIEAVFDHLGVDWKKYVKKDKRFMRPADIQAIRTDPSKAMRKMNWKARFDGRDVARMMVDAELQN